MKGFLAVFRREVGERRIVFLVAAGLSLAPFASPLLLHSRGSGSSEASLATAIVLAGALSALLAAAFGASVIAGDLGERRLAFYFARPLSGWAIWAGKLGAAFAIALATGLVVLLPTALVRGVNELVVLPQLLLLWPAALFLLLLVAHALGVIGRARTAWTLLDAAAAVFLTGSSWAVIHQLQAWDSGFMPERIVALHAAALALGLTAASAVQVTRGRTDLRRAHRLLSCTLWSVMVFAALVITGYAEWYLHPAPTALSGWPQLLAARSGRWVELTGATSGRADHVSHFLVDRATGRWLRIRPSVFWRSRHFSNVMFAADGNSAAWLEQDEAHNRSELVRIDLTRPHPTPKSTQLAFASIYMALSPDGRRIAALENNRVTVTDIASGRLLASAPLGADAAELRFVTAGRVRIFQPLLSEDVSADSEIVIDELDLGAARLRPLGRIRLTHLHFWLASPDADRLLVRTHDGDGHPVSSLYDAASGHLLAVVPHAVDETASPQFLADGRLAEVVESPARGELRLLTRDGALDSTTHIFDFAAEHRLLVCGQPSATELLAMDLGPSAIQRSPTGGTVVASEAGRGPLRFRLLRLDLAHGTSRLLVQGSAPTPELFPAILSGSRSPAVLVKVAQGWTWIDATGRQSPLVPPGR